MNNGIPENWDSEEDKSRQSEQKRRNLSRDREQRKIRKWVSAKYLSEYFDVSQVTIWTWTRQGRLPKPKKFSDNCTRWNLQEIQETEAA